MTGAHEASGLSCQGRGCAAHGEVEVLSPDHESFYVSPTPTTHGRKRISSGLISPRKVWKPQPLRVITDWLGLMEPARRESCTSGLLRGHAAPGEDRFPSPGQKSFQIPTTPTTRGRKLRFLGSISPRKVWKPQPIWLVADWLGFMQPARDESCLSRQRRCPATPGEDRVSPSD